MATKKKKSINIQQLGVLANAFNGVVNGFLSENSSIMGAVLSNITEQELATVQQGSMIAQQLQEVLEQDGAALPADEAEKIETALMENTIAVSDMWTGLVLRTIDADQLGKLIPGDARTEEVSQAFTSLEKVNLAKVFAPKPSI